MRLTIPKPPTETPEEAVLRAELAKLDQQEAQQPQEAPAKSRKQAKAEFTDAEKALRQANKLLSTVDLLAQLKRELPAAHHLAQVYGQWVWLEFPSKPHETVRKQLMLLGFTWSHKRKAWYHSCGVFSHHSKTDPRWKYQAIPATEMEAEGAIYLDAPNLSARVSRVVTA